MSEELHLQIEQFMARRRLKNKSQVLRDLIETGLEAERQKQRRGPLGATPGSHTSDGQGPGLTIALTDELRDCVEMGAKLHGLEPATLVQLLLSEHIETLIERGKHRREELRRLSEGKQQLDHQPEGE
jgi:hypothetical protein